MDMWRVMAAKEELSRACTSCGLRSPAVQKKTLWRVGSRANTGEVHIVTQMTRVCYHIAARREIC